MKRAVVTESSAGYQNDMAGSLPPLKQDSMAMRRNETRKAYVETTNSLDTEILPLKGILALSPEEIYMGLELQFEDIVLLNTICFHWGADRVAKEWQTGQWIIILKSSQVVHTLEKAIYS